MMSVKQAVATVRSAVTGLESSADALADWMKLYTKELALVATALVVSIIGTLAYNTDATDAPVEAADSITIVETHSTTITQITQAPSLVEAPRPTEKAAVVVVRTTEASQAPSSSTTASTTLPSITTSASEDSSAPAATTKLPTMSTTSAPPSSTTTSAVTPASASSNS